MVKKEVKEPRHLKTTSSTSRSVVKAEHIDEVSTVPSVYTNQFRRRIVEVNLEKGRSGMTKAVWDTLGEEVGQGCVEKGYAPQTSQGRLHHTSHATQIDQLINATIVLLWSQAIENGKA
ncbi:unnamed protein product [Sympodiomycopsis kandeliae]